MRTAPFTTGGAVMANLLTERVLYYQALIVSPHKKEREKAKALYLELCNECRKIFYTYPVKVRILEEEEAIELLLSMEGRLKHLIQNFEYQHISFDHYVRKIAYLQAQLLVRKKAKEARKYSSIFKTIDEIDEQLVADDTVLYKIAKDGSLCVDKESQWSENSPRCTALKEKLQENQIFKMRVVQLIIKCCDNLNARQIAFLANFLEFDEKELATLLAQSHDLSNDKRERTKHLIAVRNAHFRNRQFLRNELEMLKEYNAEPLQIERIQKKLQRSEYLFERSLNELTNRPNPVTHAVIATQLGIPKGTVDSGMHSLKRIIQKLLDDYK